MLIPCSLFTVKERTVTTLSRQSSTIHQSNVGVHAGFFAFRYSVTLTQCVFNHAVTHFIDNHRVLTNFGLVTFISACGFSWRRRYTIKLVNIYTIVSFELSLRDQVDVVQSLPNTHDRMRVPILSIRRELLEKG